MTQKDVLCNVEEHTIQNMFRRVWLEGWLVLSE